VDFLPGEHELPGAPAPISDPRLTGDR